jgi:hypothetical protein
MKPFTIETPVMRLGTITKWSQPYYQYRQCCVCHAVLAKMFKIDRPSLISLKLSTRPSREAQQVKLYLVNGFFEIESKPFDNTTWLRGLSTDEWLRKNTPLGQLRPGESATVYVTLFVH